jgi:hypothetical protein
VEEQTEKFVSLKYDNDYQHYEVTGIYIHMNDIRFKHDNDHHYEIQHETKKS